MPSRLSTTSEIDAMSSKMVSDFNAVSEIGALLAQEIAKKVLISGERVSMSGINGLKFKLGDLYSDMGFRKELSRYEGGRLMHYHSHIEWDCNDLEDLIKDLKSKVSWKTGDTLREEVDQCLNRLVETKKKIHRIDAMLKAEEEPSSLANRPSIS